LDYALTGKLKDVPVEKIPDAPFKNGLPTMPVFDIKSDTTVSEGDNFVQKAYYMPL
jgi:hypothetical protein